MPRCSRAREPVSHIPPLAIHTNATRRPFIYSQPESSASARRKDGRGLADGRRTTNSLPPSISLSLPLSLSPSLPSPSPSLLITCCLLGPPRLELEPNRKGRQIISVSLSQWVFLRRPARRDLTDGGRTDVGSLSPPSLSARILVLAIVFSEVTASGRKE